MYNQDSVGPVLEKSNGDSFTIVLLANHAADVYIYTHAHTHIYIYTHTQLGTFKNHLFSYKNI